MNKYNIIQQLKDNEKPFGLMSEEMQEKAREIGSGHFDLWACSGQWCKVPDERHMSVDRTHRLRPDYEDEPEIEEKRIYTEGKEFYFEDDGSSVPITSAPASTNFIGFKFKDGTVAALPIRPFLIPTSPRGSSIPREVTKVQQDFSHATHVLFRRTKP